MANTRGAVGNRLSEDDWIQAGYAILAAERLKALRIDWLRGRLDVTEGSFCWHFDGMPSYRTALDESWGNCATRIVATSTTCGPFRQGNGCP
jgi:hypothetical protein